MVVTSYCVNVAPTLLLLFSWKSGNVDKERESRCICSGFYWFALSSPFAIPTFFFLVRMTMVRRLLLVRVLPGERERLLDWKQPCDHRPEALE